MSICSIEDVAENTTKPFWFQLYVMRDRDFVDRLIDRAKAAECSALVLTLDLQILGQRHKDLRNGLSAPPKITPPTSSTSATKPRWWLGMLGTKRRSFGNIVGHAKGVGDLASLAVLDRRAVRPDAHLEGRRVDQGALGRQADPEGHPRPGGCASWPRDTGADAIIVSNHGGRQLDGAPSSISALPGDRRCGRRPDRGA